MADSTLIDALGRLVADFAQLIILILGFLAQHLLVIAWFTWWLLAANWARLWDILARGGWVILLLAIVAGAAAWSQIAPSDYALLGFATISNFWWQLSAVTLLALATLLCGWLQGVMGWHPPQINFEPPPSSGHDLEPAHH
jgi:hypothetical protein